MVIDPFAGVGIVLSTSKKLNRHYWGAEISNEYYNEGFKNIYEWLHNSNESEWTETTSNQFHDIQR